MWHYTTSLSVKTERNDFHNNFPLQFPLMAFNICLDWQIPSHGKNCRLEIRHRMFNEGRAHPFHPKLEQIHCCARNFIPIYPISCPHSVEPQIDLYFVVSFRHIGDLSVCTCECNTGKIDSINTLTYWVWTYKLIRPETYTDYESNI